MPRRSLSNMTPFFTHYIRHPLLAQSFLDSPNVELTASQHVMQATNAKHDINKL